LLPQDRESKFRVSPGAQHNPDIGVLILDFSAAVHNRYMRLRTALFFLIAWTAFGQRLVRLQCVLNAFGESFGLPFSFTLRRGAVLT